MKISRDYGNVDIKKCCILIKLRLENISWVMQDFNYQFHHCYTSWKSPLSQPFHSIPYLFSSLSPGTNSSKFKWSLTFIKCKKTSKNILWGWGGWRGAAEEPARFYSTGNRTTRGGCWRADESTSGAQGVEDHGKRGNGGERRDDSLDEVCLMERGWLSKQGTPPKNVHIYGTISVTPSTILPPLPADNRCAPIGLTYLPSRSYSRVREAASVTPSLPNSPRSAAFPHHQRNPATLMLH